VCITRGRLFLLSVAYKQPRKWVGRYKRRRTCELWSAFIQFDPVTLEQETTSLRKVDCRRGTADSCNIWIFENKWSWIRPVYCTCVSTEGCGFSLDLHLLQRVSRLSFLFKENSRLCELTSLREPLERSKYFVHFKETVMNITQMETVPPPPQPNLSL
jgi:hypothetical protein